MRERFFAGALVLGCMLLVGSEARAAPRGGSQGELRGRCGVRDDLDPRLQDAIEAALSSVKLTEQELAGAPGVVIPVHFHVVTSTRGDGDVRRLVPAQIAVLNEAFASAGFGFQLVTLDVVASDSWFFGAQGSAEELAMKAALRQGGPEALNVYTTDADGFLGWATFPNFYDASPAYDGVVLWWASLPGGGAEFRVDRALEPDGRVTYDQGDTGTHEVGHWLGLYHTFQGGCANGGDRVKDTPAEALPQFFCVERDSCTAAGFPGLDPVTNFMDYVDDVCMFQFTANQETRMRKAWRLFRG